MEINKTVSLSYSFYQNVLWIDQIFKYVNETIKVLEGKTGDYYNNSEVKISFVKWHKSQILKTKVFNYYI